MDETQTLAVLALRELLDNPDRNDWDELVAANRALIEAIAAGRPMTRRNARIVAEYLREAGWGEGAIDATSQAGQPRKQVDTPGQSVRSAGLPPSAARLSWRRCISRRAIVSTSLRLLQPRQPLRRDDSDHVRQVALPCRPRFCIVIRPSSAGPGRDRVGPLRLPRQPSNFAAKQSRGADWPTR
jgi:hypothetical protein